MIYLHATLIMLFSICFTLFYHPSYQSIIFSLVKINNLLSRKCSFHRIFPTASKLLIYYRCIDRDAFSPPLLESTDERIKLVKFLLEYYSNNFDHYIVHFRKSVILNNCFLSSSIRLTTIFSTFIPF